MDEVRGAALREGRMPEDREIVHFYKSVKDNIRIFGRMYEIGMMGELKLLSGEYTKDMGLGLKMIARGKLKLFPDLASLGRMEKVFKAVEKMEGMV
jgi:heterodisulfide reductase subunit C